MVKKISIFENLEKIARFSPCPFYWLGLDQKYLGMNNCGLNVLDAISYEHDLAGKTPYDLFPKEMADNIVQHHKQVISTGEPISAEESIKVRDDKIKYFQASISPIYDANGNIIGTLGVSVDITAEKEAEECLKQKRLIDHISKIAELLPIPIYWFDLCQNYLGVNNFLLKSGGNKLYETDFIGKTPYDILPKGMAEDIVQHHKKVLCSKKTVITEESIKDAVGNIKYFNAFIAPLYDDDRRLIGTIGVSIDITAEKEAKRLAIENAEKNAIIAEQKRFVTVVNQFSHDIRNALGLLGYGLMKYEDDIPEEGRHELKVAKIKIENIACALLAEYNAKSKAEYAAREAKRPVLVSLTILELLAAKRYQYREQLIEFNSVFEGDNKFVFINAGLTSFDRMLSNLINNAVDAFDDKVGKVIVAVTSNTQHVKIVITDNGKGMPPEVLEKIKNNIVVTHGKANGHGIGMTQICDTIKNNNGEIDIESKVGEGTKITLTFPAIAVPEWAATEISLHHGDVIVILDDDPAIHDIWDARFKAYTNICSIKHFTEGAEAINFINNLGVDKDKIVLLTDYELLKQNSNGLNVIAETGVPRSFLVTSHFANHEVLEMVKKAQVKMLAKSLVGEVEITVADKT